MGKNILTKELLLRSVEEWNAVREAYPDIIPDLSGTSFCRKNLRSANLIYADLCGANLRDASLVNADLHGAKLSYVDFDGANLQGANLSGADLHGANLDRVNLSRGNLNGAYLRKSTLQDVNLSGATLNAAYLCEAAIHWTNLNGADLSNSKVGYTTFGAIDFSSVIGLDTIRHEWPSTIGIDTIYASDGKIPEVFLRGCGVPDNFIEYARSLTAKAFDYYSCFISHSTADKDFADRLYADLQAKGVRCWYAPHDMEGGEHIDTQIDRAIKVHEKVLLVLSESSISSNWVKREITKAVKREDAEGKRVLFPISLVDFSTLEEWTFVDSKGMDLAERIRLDFIPSFKGWENDNSLYTTEFDKLLKAFKDKSKQ